jgi:ATP-binding cassette subfamily F protein uup
MLEDVLSRYTGTLIIVSHDREFLDRTVSEVLVFGGEGNIEHHIGGYTDYIETKKQEEQELLNQSIETSVKPQTQKSDTSNNTKKTSDKVTFKIKHDYETLPARIAELQGIIKTLEDILADTELYTKNPERFDKAVTKLEQAKTELEKAEYRYLEVEIIMSEQG